MSIDLMQSVGQQIHMTITEFAEALSLGEIWHMSHRAYDHNHDLSDTPTSEEAIDYYDTIAHPNVDALIKHLKSLAEVNEVFEYQVSFSEHVDSENYVDITFTRQGDTVLVEIH